MLSRVLEAYSNLFKSYLRMFVINLKMRTYLADKNLMFIFERECLFDKKLKLVTNWKNRSN